MTANPTDTPTEAQTLSQIEALQGELREVRRMLRETRLIVAGTAMALDGKAVFRQINYLRLSREHAVCRAGLARKSVAAIENHLGREDIYATLEDLTFYARDEIASIKGLGRKSMAKLDAAMAEAGLTWASA